jgi:hypothetical protein
MANDERSLGRSADRRTAVRYHAALRVELWSAPGPRPIAPSFYTTRDISITGFHFFSHHRFETGAKLCFRIVVPGEFSGRTVELMGGLAECVRVEEVFRSEIDRYGVGVLIEKTINLVGDR